MNQSSRADKKFSVSSTESTGHIEFFFSLFSVSSVVSLFHPVYPSRGGRVIRST